MKRKIFVGLLAMALLLGQTLSAYALNAPLSRAAGKAEVWTVSVTNNSGGPLFHGDALVWNVAGDSGETLGESVKLTTTANDETVAGVVAVSGRSTPILDGERFEMQIWGRIDVLPANADVVEGQALGTGIVTRTAADGDGLGFALSGDSGGTVQAFIQVMGSGL